MTTIAAMFNLFREKRKNPPPPSRSSDRKVDLGGGHYATQHRGSLYMNRPKTPKPEDSEPISLARALSMKSTRSTRVKHEHEHGRRRHRRAESAFYGPTSNSFATGRWPHLNSDKAIQTEPIVQDAFVNPPAPNPQSAPILQQSFVSQPAALPPFAANHANYGYQAPPMYSLAPQPVPSQHFHNHFSSTQFYPVNIFSHATGVPEDPPQNRAAQSGRVRPNSGIASQDRRTASGLTREEERELIGIDEHFRKLSVNPQTPAKARPVGEQQDREANKRTPCHTCGICGRLRSRHYHNAHPIIGNRQPEPSICSICAVNSNPNETEIDFRPPPRELRRGRARHQSVSFPSARSTHPVRREHSVAGSDSSSRQIDRLRGRIDHVSGDLSLAGPTHGAHEGQVGRPALHRQSGEHEGPLNGEYDRPRDYSPSPRPRERRRRQPRQSARRANDYQPYVEDENDYVRDNDAHNPNRRDRLLFTRASTRHNSGVDLMATTEECSREETRRIRERQEREKQTKNRDDRRQSVRRNSSVRPSPPRPERNPDSERNQRFSRQREQHSPSSTYDNILNDVLRTTPRSPRIPPAQFTAPSSENFHKEHHRSPAESPNDIFPSNNTEESRKVANSQPRRRSSISFRYVPAPGTSEENLRSSQNRSNQPTPQQDGNASTHHSSGPSTAAEPFPQYNEVQQDADLDEWERAEELVAQQRAQASRWPNETGPRSYFTNSVYPNATTYNKAGTSNNQPGQQENVDDWGGSTQHDAGSSWRPNNSTKSCFDGIEFAIPNDQAAASNFEGGWDGPGPGCDLFDDNNFPNIDFSRMYHGSSVPNPPQTPPPRQRRHSRVPSYTYSEVGDTPESVRGLGLRFINDREHDDGAERAPNKQSDDDNWGIWNN